MVDDTRRYALKERALRKAMGGTRQELWRRAPATMVRRIQSIDAFRVYAMVLIVAVHSEENSGLGATSMTKRVFLMLLCQSVRCAMPFFFVTAGFFLAPKLEGRSPIDVGAAMSYSKRILQVFLFWSVVYAIEEPIAWNLHELRSAGAGGAAMLVLRHLSELARDPVRLLLEGTRFHLWFLVALVSSLWLYVLTVLCRGTISLFLVVGAVLYSAGLLAGAYRVTSFGFDTRDGPFFGSLFFGIGVWWARKRPSITPRGALLIVAAGVALSCAELEFLHLYYRIDDDQLRDTSFLIGTIPFGLGVTLYAMQHEDTALDRRVGPWGREVLGIYVCHLLFIDVLRRLRFHVPSGVMWCMFPVIIFLASLAFTRFVSRTRFRNLVGA